MRKWVAFNSCFSAIWTMMAVGSAEWFFRAASTRDWIIYATLIAFTTVTVATLRLWYGLEIRAKPNDD